MLEIRNMADLCNYFGVDFPRELNRRIYKDTSCGASISVLVASQDPEEFGYLRDYEPPQWVHDGDRAWQYMTIATRLVAFSIQTIVEGSDATVDSGTFYLPVSTLQVESWIAYMEEEADRLWDEANDPIEES